MINYSLVVRNILNRSKYDKLSKALEEFDLKYYVFDGGEYFENEKEADFLSWEEQEWTKHDPQMIILSEKFPEMIFELTCFMKDKFWKVYYKDGSSEICTGEVIWENPKKINWNKCYAF